MISRVASVENEGGLCHAALDASVTDVQRVCSEYRWDQEGGDCDAGPKESKEAENARYLQQYNARSFTWSSIPNGNTQIRLSLPPEVAQAFLNSVEHSLEQLELNDDSMPQRRADAAVLMAETSLQLGGKSVSTADRYQVIVSVDAKELGSDATQLPAKRPMVQRTNPLAQETARRVACDCSVSAITLSNGEPVSIGRKSRLWPPAMARAIKTRDQHCQYPGCNQTQHLHIHHIKHWADGGETSIENGVCLCHAHHILVHEGGYSIERISADDSENTAGPEQLFNRQRSTSKSGTSNAIEAMLRNNRESFDYIRKLSPTRFRFRVVNQAGIDVRDVRDVRDVLDVRDVSNSQVDQSTLHENGGQHTAMTQDDSHLEHSTRVDKRNFDNGKRDMDWPGIAEEAARYSRE